ncbi:hypothetical protein CDAR_436771 [Caerostris darwini]|uniref:Uncharacterized protein n=1 Tax=Caerostris darwini TaxID=1538125 RepID=A0AAV4STW6_9ARAC|nr:hypothetical protein CDAR_436771 [Caerostris darwini]
MISCAHGSLSSTALYETIDKEHTTLSALQNGLQQKNICSPGTTIQPFKTVRSKSISVPQAQQFVSVHGNDTMVSLPPVSNPATPCSCEWKGLESCFGCNSKHRWSVFTQHSHLYEKRGFWKKRLTKNILPSVPFRTVCGERISVPQARQLVSVHANDTTVSLPPLSNPATPCSCEWKGLESCFGCNSKHRWSVFTQHSHLHEKK